MKTVTAQILSIVLAGLVMGVFWGTWFTLTRNINDFEPACFLHIGKTIIHNVKVPMQVMMPSTLVCLTMVCFFTFRQRPVFVITAVSLLLMIITTVITVGVEVPLDNMIKTWTVATMPSNWEVLRHRWEVYHTYRTFTSIGSFVLLSVSLVIKPFLLPA